jgi:DNA repair protein RAD50
MNCADYTDVYWRVGRDKDQESFIERQNIAEVS